MEPGTPEVVREAEPAGSEPTTSETKSDLNGTPVLQKGHYTHAELLALVREKLAARQPALPAR